MSSVRGQGCREEEPSASRMLLSPSRSLSSPMPYHSLPSSFLPFLSVFAASTRLTLSLPLYFLLFHLPSLPPSLPPSLSLPSSFPPSLHASHACYSRLTIPSTQSSEETFVSMEVCTNILHEAKESVKRASVVCVHSLLRKRGRALPLSLSAAAG